MVNEKDVVEKLKTIIDPELETNIYDLGLVYGIKTGEGGIISIDMTLTAKGCPIGEIIKFEAEEALKKISGVKGVNINLVWDPPWTPSMIKEDALKKLKKEKNSL